MFRILLVDDYAELSALVATALSNQFEVIIAESIAEAEKKLTEGKFDLILLDVSLPDGDGYLFCGQLRNSPATKEIPVIFLTGNSESTGKVLGFSLGADDYVTKPFDLPELRARIEARLKPKPNGNKQIETFSIGNLTLNNSVHKAILENPGTNQTVEMTPSEFKILYFLAKKEGEVFSRKEIIAAIWGADFQITERTIDTHIYNLRKKLAVCSHEIKSIHGTGYKFTMKATATKSAA